MSDSFVHFRSTKDLNKRLDTEVAALRKKGVAPRLANRSALVRTLLLDSLKAPKRLAVAGEVLLHAQVIARRAAERALESAAKNIDEVLSEELEAL